MSLVSIIDRDNKRKSLFYLLLPLSQWYFDLRIISSQNDTVSNFTYVEMFQKLSFTMYVVSTYSYLASKHFYGGLTVDLCIEELAVFTGTSALFVNLLICRSGTFYVISCTHVRINVHF